MVISLCSFIHILPTYSAFHFNSVSPSTIRLIYNIRVNDSVRKHTLFLLAMNILSHLILTTAADLTDLTHKMTYQWYLEEFITNIY